MSLFSFLMAEKRRKNAKDEFGRLVRNHRERLGMTINQLARKVDMDQGLLSKIERGLRPPPQIVPHVQRIANALGLEPKSADFKELTETAYRVRFQAKKQSTHIPEIITLTLQ